MGVQSQPFPGLASLAYPFERLAFWLTLLLVLPAALAVGFLLHQSIGISTVALFVVGTMIYVTLARGRLLGSSVRVHEAQHPHIFSIVKRACSRLDLPTPMVFVREDRVVPVVALGFGEPYSLVISSDWTDHLQDDELSFLVGRELGHIASGHTRFLSLLSVNGNANAIVSLLFGAWLRRCDLTCDRIGLLICGSLDAATRAIAVATFHGFGRSIDLATFAEQARELKADPVLRWGEWLGGEPYATVRIEAMAAFRSTEAYLQAQTWFARETPAEPPALQAPGSGRVVKKDCAGWWRRLAAIVIDAVIVYSIVSALGAADIVKVAPSQKTAASVHVSVGNAVSISNDDASGFKPDPNASPLDNARGYVDHFFARVSYGVYLPIYLALLVGLSGQTFGMMIAGLRVVTTDFRKPGIARTLWRYLIVLLLWWASAIGSLFSRRVLLHDWASGTRVIKVERALERTGPA